MTTRMKLSKERTEIPRIPYHRKKPMSRRESATKLKGQEY